MVDFSNIDLQNLASFIYEILKSNGIDAILVGGACVSIYTQNRYQSYDLDFATYEDLKLIEGVLIKLGFKRMGRCFVHPECPYLIDFINPPIAIGNESIRYFETLKTSSGGVLQLLTDCVKDRLSAFFHWNDQQAFEQALLVSKSQLINLNNVKRWAKAEGHQGKSNYFLKRLNSISS